MFDGSVSVLSLIIDDYIQVCLCVSLWKLIVTEVACSRVLAL